MNPTDLKLYELLGDQTLSFGCMMQVGDIPGKLLQTTTVFGVEYIVVQYSDGEMSAFPISDPVMKWKIIGHEPTIFDLHKWLFRNGFVAIGHYELLPIFDSMKSVKYDSSKSLLEQEEETKKAIINLIEEHEPTMSQRATGK